VFTLTKKAIFAVGRYIAGSEKPKAGLRKEVTVGGCSGHQYGLKPEGTVIDCNTTGAVGSIGGNDAFRLTLKVEDESGIIAEAGLQSFGCGSAIASSSELTEIAKGMKLNEALKVTNQDIADYLEGLPIEKMHCPVMSREALQAAITNLSRRRVERRSQRRRSCL